MTITTTRPELSWLHFLERGPAWRAQAAAAALGALASLAQAPFHIIPAFAVGLVGLVWLLDGAYRSARPLRAAFARGWSFAFGYFLAGLYWVGFAFLQVEGAAPLIPLAVTALPAGLALFWGAALAAAMAFWTPDARRLPVLAAMLTIAEFARGRLFTGFPWNLPATIWPAGDPVSQIAAAVGVYGLTALTLLFFAAPACLTDRSAGDGLGRRAAPLLASMLALGLMWGAGAQRLAKAPVEGPHPGPIVRVADAGFSQAEKWAPGRVWDVFDRYVSLIGDDVGSRASVHIWPEGAIPAPILESPDMMQALGKALGDRVLVVGTPRFAPPAPGGKEERLFNSAAVLDGVSGDIRLSQVYDKHHLVPFGEYIPFWDLLSGAPIAPLQRIGRGYTAGDRPERIVIPGGPPASILICYEVIFPGAAPRGVERPDWLINISIDSWYGRQTGPWQHFNQARYRAVEEGLPLARAASGGVSALVDGYGRVLTATGLDGGAVEAALPAALEPTPYALFGDVLPAALVILILALRFAPLGIGRGGLAS